jgi:hypothetical protein
MAINPTAQQLAKQAQITSIIDDLQAKLAAVTNKDDIEIAPELFDLFAAFDINASKSITGTEITTLTNHLAFINTNANIVKIFDASGNPITANVQVDINKDGQLKATGANNDVLALNTLLTAKTNNLVSFNKPQTIAALNATDKTLFQTLAAMPGVSDEDEDFFLLKIAGRPIDQRLKQSYVNIFNNGTATDEKITLLLDLVNHQATATAARQGNSDYLDLFYLNFETAANISNSQILVDILKSADSPKRTLYINSLNTISQNGDSQFLTNSVINDYKNGDTLGDGLTAAEITKFNSFTVKTGVSDADRTNYYRMLLANPNGVLLTAFENMFEPGGNYSLAKSNLLLTANSNANLRTAGTSQDYFLAAFSASSSANDATNINTITANTTNPTRTNYVSSLATLYNNGRSSNVLRVLSDDITGNVNINNAMGVPELNKLQSFISRTNETNTDQNRYLKYVTMPLPDPWISSFENMFSTGTVNDTRRSVFDAASGNTTLKNTAKYNTMFLDLFNDPSKVNYAGSLNSITTQNNPTKENYIDSLKAAADAGISDKMAAILDRAIGITSPVALRLDNKLTSADFMKFQTLFTNGASTSQEDALFVALSRNADNDPNNNVDPDIIDAYVNSFSNGTKSTVKTDIFKRATVNAAINANGVLQDLYTKTYPGLDVSTTLAGYVLEVAEKTSFTGVALAEAPALRQRYIDSIGMINQNTGTVFQSSGLPEVITALNSNHKNNLNITRAMTQANINTFDTFTDRLSDQPVDRERFFKYLLVDKIADQGKPTQANYTNLWISNFDQMFAQNYANANRSNLYDVAFNNASVSGSKKYTDMFFDMFKKPTNPPTDPGYNYANTLANTSTGIASSTKVNATVKEVYIDNLKSSFAYGLSDQMATLLERQINTSYVTNKVFSNADLDKFKILFDKNATIQQQDLLFKAISAGKDPDLINAYVNSFVNGTITSDTDITTPPPAGYTPKTVLFERAIASSLTNDNGDLQDLFLFAYNNAGGKTSIQAEQLLNIIETPDATFPANPKYVDSLKNINKNLAVVAKGSGFEDIMNALAANQKIKINISRSLSNADIDKFDKFNDRSTDNPTDRERFFKYLLTDKIPGGQNLTTAWIDSFDKMFKDDYVSDNRRVLFDKAYEQTSISSSAKYSNIFIEMFNRSANGYDYANSLVNTMINSANPSKDKYIDNLKKSADLAMPVSMISFLERHLNTGDVLNRTLTDTEFSEYRTLLNATATVPTTADNDDLDKLFKMHTLNLADDSGVDNDYEAAFAKMFKDGTINIGKTPTTPSSKETLLDRFLPVSIAAEVLGQSKIDLVDKSINGKIVTAEQQQLDFLKYFNKDQYIDFSKELIIDNFMVSYQFPTKQQQITLYALSTLAPGGTETPAELAARTETLKKIQAPDLDPKLSSKERFTQFKTIFEGELQKADPTLAELIKANPELGNLKQAELLDNFILKIANTALNGLPLDKTTQEQKIIFAETMAAILKIDNSTAANVANGTANNIAQYYIPSLNNMLALNADEKLVKTLKRFAEAGRKLEGWMTAEDIKIFSEISNSAYFKADEAKYTDLYLEMALSLKSISPEEKERKDNFRTAFRDIFLFDYSVPIPPDGKLPDANLTNFDAKLNILSSLIKGLPADDKLYSFKILKTPTNPNSFYEYGETYKNADTTDTKDYSGIKLLKDDETNILNYLSTLETSNYALSSLGLINSQRTATPNIKTGNTDVQLQDAKNNVNSVTFPTNLTDTEKAAEQAKYIANIDIIDNYVGVNGFDVDAKSSKLSPGVVQLTASLLKLSTQLINFTGDAFNKTAQELEIAANYVLNSGNPLNDKLPDGTLLVDKISNSINNWLNAPEQKKIYANNVLADSLTSLLKPIIKDTENTDNPILTSALSTAVNSVAPGNISNSQLAAKNLFTGSTEDLVTKKLSALSSIYKTGQSINTPITSDDLSFMDKFEDIYQKYSIDNDALYKNIITKFADPSTQTLVNNVLNKLIQEDNNQINSLSYSERRNGSKFILDALNKILNDPTKSIIPGNDDKTRLANLEKSFNGNGNKLYPEAYNDIVNLLLNQQAVILDAKKTVINALPNTTDEEKEAKKKAMLELDTVRSSVQKIMDYPKDSLTQYFTKKGKSLGNQFNTKLNDFTNLVTNEATDSDMDLLKAYAERSIAGSSLTSNIKTLVEYDGKDGFKLNALPENLDDSTITTASKLIQLAKDLQQGTPSEADSILIKYLENTTNLILNSGGGNRNYLKDFINNTAFTQVESVLSASPRHVNISKVALENLLEPYEFINKGINNYDPELMTAYANLTKNNPSEETLNRFENIITYQGSNSFKLNAGANIQTLSAKDLKDTVDKVYDLINKADELSQIAEFANSGLIGYLERNANLFLKNSLSGKEETAIKNFTKAFMDSINTTLMNNDLTPSVVNELLSSFSLDSESVVDGSSLNYIPYSIQSAEAAGKRNAEGKLVFETVGDKKDKLIYSDAINNAFFRKRGFTKTVTDKNIDTIEVNKPTVKAQVLLYQALKTGVESLITLEKAKSEDQQDSTKISTLESSLASYVTMIDTLTSLT